MPPARCGSGSSRNGIKEPRQASPRSAVSFRETLGDRPAGHNLDPSAGSRRAPRPSPKLCRFKSIARAMRCPDPPPAEARLDPAGSSAAGVAGRSFGSREFLGAGRIEPGRSAGPAARHFERSGAAAHPSQSRRIAPAWWVGAPLAASTKAVPHDRALARRHGRTKARSHKRRGRTKGAVARKALPHEGSPPFEMT